MRRWEITGFVFIVCMGAGLHFLFDLAGRPAGLGPFMPVNESVWEHLKLAVWPTVLWVIVEAVAWRGKPPNFLVAKCVGFLAMPVVILIIFHSYYIFVGHPVLAVDISSFVIAVFVGQLISLNVLNRTPVPRLLSVLFYALSVCYLAAVVLFTFSPPKLHDFYDRPTGTYGIFKIK